MENDEMFYSLFIINYPITYFLNKITIYIKHPNSILWGLPWDYGIVPSITIAKLGSHCQ